MRKQIELICPKCNKNYLKADSEYKRNNKLGRENFCSLSCAGNIQNIPNWQEGRIENLTSTNRIDNFTPFRYYIKLIKNSGRKESSLTLSDLELIWKKQHGICPYTKINLNLQNHSMSHKDYPFYTWASLDRIDSKKSYTIDNVEFVSYAINLLKNRYSKSEVFDFLHLIKNVEQDANSGY